MSGIPRRRRVVMVAGLVLAAALAAPAVAGASGTHRYVIVARKGFDVAEIRAAAATNGLHVVKSMGRVGVLVVYGRVAAVNRLRDRSDVRSVGRDHVIRLAPPDQLAMQAAVVRRSLAAASPLDRLAPAFRPDPAFRLPGLLWDYGRIGAPSAWGVTTGSPNIVVGVADTGLDYTHYELRSQVVKVVDFTDFSEHPSLCKQLTGISDRDLAREDGAPITLDYNGHGSWIGGNIAAAANGKGTNGLAPGVKLVSLKISQWCGTAFDSEAIASFYWAANHGVDVVNNSFGGYLDRTDPEQDAVWRAYFRVARYARAHGTIIVASAGNEHVRVGAAGRVVSHGSLTTPGDPAVDLFGLFEAPGGVPGVVDVSSTGNVVVPSSAHCSRASLSEPAFETCKPRSDRHQAAGQGTLNQLAYYSDYGPRIDVAAPGGARKFNLPNYDRGGTPGFPYTTADGTRAFEVFSTTSNHARGIPCFTFTGRGFPTNQCYSTIQGTSMAAPHVAAALALIASAHPEWRHNTNRLVAQLKATARMHTNHTRALSATDRSPADDPQVFGFFGPCRTGYCHLTGPRISDRDAYGAGLIDLARAVR